MSPARSLVAVRLAFLVGTAVTLLWAPFHGGLPSFSAYGPGGRLFFGAFAQWDAGWFLRIAQHGYDTKQSAAFFPLYPLVVRGVAVVLRSTLAAGVVVSLVSAAGAAEVLLRIARTRLDTDSSRNVVLLVALYPIAYVFTSVYSDGLFLFLAAGSFYAALRGRSLTAGVLGGLAVASRLLGLALVPALLILLWRRGWRGLAPVLLLPAALGVYAFYLHEHFGDAFAFAHAEGAFWLRHTPTLGPLTGIWDAVHSGEQGLAQLVRHLPPPGHYGKPEQYAIWNLVQLVLLVVAVWLTWVAWRRLGAAFGAYSAATLLIVLSSPAAVVPLVSLPRFLLADFPLFLALAPYRRVLVPAFAAVGAAAAVAFSRGIWIA